ncbi:hypothetical protein PUNSTDRAFT_120685 [Punctularia strigosozonata HHB-11173 SS5]|uniref:uncharacterized protein n=1 Tax=Punctularia strigosozonata (strain HHB-11173) TaxID=741275 RepID=UPI00044175B1|nr:uncharacterized protein PUNSTDRAFT_120685 [Punctularia strigosozonata HHB-11173 SS5]EIN08266.1 hypothetical protein PUNSTDRAFT_120685 [Punctularia strigosozonata HHB-11173 SS5]
MGNHEWFNDAHKTAFHMEFGIKQSQQLVIKSCEYACHVPVIVPEWTVARIV